MKRLIIGIAAVIAASFAIEKFAEDSKYDDTILDVETLPEPKVNEDGETIEPSAIESFIANTKFHAIKLVKRCVKIVVRSSKFVTKNVRPIFKDFSDITMKFIYENPETVRNVVFAAIPVALAYANKMEKTSRFWDPSLNRFWYAKYPPTKMQINAYNRYRNARNLYTGELVHSVKESLDYAGISVR